MSFDRIKDVLPFITAIGPFVAAFGLMLTVIQLYRNWKIQKAQFLTTIIKDFFADDGLRRFFYKIDYGKFEFDENKIEEFKHSDDERWLDTLLYRYDLLGRLVRMKLLALDDLEFLAFELSRVFNDEEVNKYIKWLESEFEKYGDFASNKRPHDDARWLIEKFRQKRLRERVSSLLSSAINGAKQ